ASSSTISATPKCWCCFWSRLAAAISQSRNPMLRGFEIVLAGGSGGLGSAAAELLAQEGARLIVSYRANADRAERLKPIATVMQADLTNAADRTRLLDAASQLYGVVVFTGDPARLPDPEAAMRRAYEANYLGPILLAREAADRMQASGTQGAIVLFSTMQAVSLFPGSTGYGAAIASRH